MNCTVRKIVAPGKRLSFMGGLGLILIVGLAAAACSPGIPTVTPTLGLAPATQAVPVTGNNLSVVVNDQASDGSSVVVARVVSKGPGWIAIHNQQNGALGPAIGHAAVKDGENANVVVPLDKSQATPVMYAMLHVDTGQVGVYEFPGPDVPAMLNGQMLAPPFKITLGQAPATQLPSITVQDQDVSSGKVTIAEVDSNGPGWVAIHIQGPDGQPGTDIGYTSVNPGVNKNVVVTIDRARVTPVMYAMLHTDASQVGVYEFPGPDVPQEANGAMVAPSFRTSAAVAAQATVPSGEYGAGATPGAGYGPAATPSAMTGAAETPGVPAETPMEGGMVMATPSGGATPLVTVSDQRVSNGTVRVQDVMSNGPGWIVIYSMKNGQPDQPIGYTAVRDGDNPNVVVTVDASKVSATLYAQLHVDAGKVGVFEFPGPDAPLMIGVQMISGVFKATTGLANAGNRTPTPSVEPSIAVADQQIHDGKVIIPKVVSVGEAWLVIHPQTPDGQMGDYIGYTLVPDGVSTNVVVPVNTRRTTRVLYAMLHVNVARGIQPIFPGPDIPVMVGGQMVAPTFNVVGDLTGDVPINVASSPTVGDHLVDFQGVSLYISLNDQPGKSSCTGDCLQNWRPLVAFGRLVPGQGVQTNKLGIIVRPDGARQVTYGGQPLYYFAHDSQPGNTNGQGIDGTWFVVQP